MVQFLGSTSTIEELRISKFHFPYYTMASLVNIGVMFYLLIFTPRNFILGMGEWIFALIISISFGGTLIINRLITKYFVPFYDPYHQNTMEFFDKVFHLPTGGEPYSMTSKYFVISCCRWFILVAIIGSLDFLMYWGFLRQFRIIIWGHHVLPPTGAVYYIFFVMMVPHAIWRFNHHANKLLNDRSKIEMKLIGVSYALMFCFLAIVAFSLRVYPHIPVARGGGNFAESPRVKLAFKALPGLPFGFNTNDPAMLALSSSSSFVIIEQTSDSLYLANVTNAGGPEAWAEMQTLPQVIEIRRDAVDQITYTQFTDTNYSPSTYIEMRDLKKGLSWLRKKITFLK